MEKRRDSVTDHGKQFRERPAVAPEREIADEQESTQELALPVRQSLQAQFGRAEVDMALSGEDTSPFGTFILSEWAMGAAGLGSLTDASPDAGAQVHGMLHSQEWSDTSAGIINRYATSNEPAHAHLAMELIRRSRGQRLPADVASRLSAALGVDISDAIIHTDTAAAQAADAVNAHAFATGKDVFFAAGKYQPGTKDGDELLAHELTHVVQDAEGRIPFTSGEGLTVSTPNQTHEREAERAGRDAASMLHDSSANDMNAADTSMSGPGPGTDVVGSVGLDAGPALHRQEAAEGAQQAEKEGEGKKSGWGEVEWTGFFEEEIVAISNAEVAQEILYTNRNRKRFDKSIWDAHCIHMDSDSGDMYERLNTISRTMPATEFKEMIRPSIKRGVDWVQRQNELLLDALEDRKFTIVIRLLNDQQTLRNRMQRIDQQRATVFGTLSDWLNWNADVPEQSANFDEQEQILFNHVEAMKNTLRGLRNYLSTGEISEEFQADFEVDEFDARGVGVQDVTTAFIPYIDSKIATDHALARDALGNMIFAVREAAWALEKGAETGESAATVTKFMTDMILSVYIGLPSASTRATPTALETASRLWALDVVGSIAQRSGEVVAKSGEGMTFGDLSRQFASDVASDVAVSAICRVWSVGYGGAADSLKRVLDVDFGRRVGESAVSYLLRKMISETVVSTPGDLVSAEMKANVEQRYQGDPVTPKAADEIIGETLLSEAAKPWIQEALERHSIDGM